MRDLTTNSIEIEQAIFFCCLCFKKEQSSGKEIVMDPWPSCCTKKMNILPVDERHPIAVRNRINIENWAARKRKKLYVTSMDRT